MEGPPLGPGGEDITWPDQVAPRGRKASSTRKIKPQTSNRNRPPRLFILRALLLLQHTFHSIIAGITNNSPLTVWVGKPETIPINKLHKSGLENLKVLPHLWRPFNFCFLPCQFHPATL